MTLFSNSQKSKAQNIFMLLKKQPETWLKHNEIIKCEACYGTGLKATKLKGRSGYSWTNTNAYCDECYGVGFLGFNKNIDFDGTKYMCPKCQSVGCDECDHTGFVDWISHIMGKGN